MQKLDPKKACGSEHGIWSPDPKGSSENSERAQRIPSFGTHHQILSLRIAAALLLHVQTGNLGQVLQAPCDVRLSRELIIQPDIAFIRKERSGLVGETSVWGPPDLVIEILARETRERDRIARRNMYSRFEVKEYWIVDPDLEILEVLLWSEWGYAVAGVYGRSGQLYSPTLPEFRLPLCGVFDKKS